VGGAAAEEAPVRLFAMTNIIVLGKSSLPEEI